MAGAFCGDAAELQRAHTRTGLWAPSKKGWGTLSFSNSGASFRVSTRTMEIAASVSAHSS